MRSMEEAVANPLSPGKHTGARQSSSISGAAPMRSRAPPSEQAVPIQARIVSMFNADRVTWYIIDVMEGTSAWFCCHRFNDFKVLDQRLQNGIGCTSDSQNSLKLPTQGFFGIRHALGVRSFEENRATQLQTYLDVLTEHLCDEDTSMNVALIRKFLQEDAVGSKLAETGFLAADPPPPPGLLTTDRHAIFPAAAAGQAASAAHQRGPARMRPDIHETAPMFALDETTGGGTQSTAALEEGVLGRGGLTDDTAPLAVGCSEASGGEPTINETAADATVGATNAANAGSAADDVAHVPIELRPVLEVDDTSAPSVTDVPAPEESTPTAPAPSPGPPSRCSVTAGAPRLDVLTSEEEVTLAAPMSPRNQSARGARLAPLSTRELTMCGNSMSGVFSLPELIVDLLAPTRLRSRSSATDEASGQSSPDWPTAPSSVSPSLVSFTSDAPAPDVPAPEGLTFGAAASACQEPTPGSTSTPTWSATTLASKPYGDSTSGAFSSCR